MPATHIPSRTDVRVTPGVRPELVGVRAYAASAGVDPAQLRWKLDANECPPLPGLDLHPPPETLVSRYPSTTALEAELSERLGLDTRGVVVTAGGDDAIDRVCRASLGPGRAIVVATPTFEMIPRYAVLAGGVVREVAWADGVFPTEAMIAAARARRDGAVPAVLAVVSPNNPTGCVATAEDLRRVSAAAPNALLMVDLAYTEFAEEDLTAFALGLPNAVVIRTFSKAYGLAGLRVGYAASRNTRVIDALRAAGHPYPCSAWSVWAAGRALAVRPEGVRERAARAARERTLIGSALRGVGAVVPEGAGSSRANFVLARHPRCASLWEGLLARGVLVKRWTGRAGLEDALRITCPLEDRGCDAVVRAIADTGAQLEQRR